MADLKLDPVTGDLDLSSGDLQIVDGAEAIAQHIRIRLRTFLGEWHLDTRIGVPYFEKILIKNPQTNVVRRILRQVVAETPGVLAINEFSTDYEGATRSLVVTLAARVDGDELLEFTDRLIIGVV